MKTYIYFCSIYILLYFIYPLLNPFLFHNLKKHVLFFYLLRIELNYTLLYYTFNINVDIVRRLKSCFVLR